MNCTGNSSIKLAQGDSSAIMAIQVYQNGVRVTDLDGYEGEFALIKKLGDSPIFTKDMDIFADEFRVEISPAESGPLAPGNYIGICQITNNVLEFCRETQVAIAVTQQGFAS